MENNSLGDIAIAAQSGKTLAELAKEHVDRENERYRIKNCADISADACSAKMYQERHQFLKDLALFGLDMTPIVGEIKGLLEAQTALEYLMAVPFVGKLDKLGKIGQAIENALKKGDFDEANRLIQNAKKEQAVAGKPQVGNSGNKPTSSIEDNVSAVTPVGAQGKPIMVIDGANKPSIINNRPFSGHALDRMQKQGITPTVVESIIQSSQPIKGKVPGTMAYHDRINNITVITNEKTGRVVTVDYGIIKQ